MAPTFIWIHLEKKAKSDRINLHRDVPNSLKKHHEYDQIKNMPLNENRINFFFFLMKVLEAFDDDK